MNLSHLPSLGSLLRRIQWLLHRSLTVLRDLNNTYLQDVSTSGCSVNGTRPQCSNEIGGLFDEGSSTTWSSAAYSNLGTAAENNAGETDDLWGSDDLAINSTLFLPGFPLGIIRGSLDPPGMHMLGLGRNSTLLHRLLTIGAVASNTFGFFQGWTGAQSQHQSDGVLTLGGYDAAKLMGTNVTQPFTLQDNCNGGLIISVTDIKMNLKNGSSPSIVGQSQGSAMRACLEPGGSVMTMSEDIWWAFTNVTGVGETGRSLSPFTFWGMTIPANGA